MKLKFRQLDGENQPLTRDFPPTYPKKTYQTQAHQNILLWPDVGHYLVPTPCL